MAYASTVAYAHDNRVQGRETIVTVTETGGVDASHVVEIDVPVAATITAIDAVLTPGDGTATTIDTGIGETAVTVGIYDNGSPAASIRSVTSVRCVAVGNVWHLRSRADGTTGTTGRVVTTIIFTHGHI